MISVVAIIIALLAIVVTVASVAVNIRTNKRLQRCKCGHLRGNHVDDGWHCELFECLCCEFEEQK